MQLAAAAQVVRAWCARWGIGRERILKHATVDPARRSDPRNWDEPGFLDRVFPPAPEPPAEGYYLPSNDPLTLDAIASGDVYQMYVKRRWWNEHAVRLLDAGDVAQARAVLRDMADRERGLDYVIERALQ